MLGLQNTAGEPFVAGLPSEAAMTVDILPFIAVRILLDRNSAALARVYGLLGTMNLEPVSTRSERHDLDAIRLVLDFGPVGRPRIDLFLRKVTQLTDCIEAKSE